MPDARLERTRNPTPTVPACIRLDHLWRYAAPTDEYVCLRCRLRVDRVLTANVGISRPSDPAVAKGAPYCEWSPRERSF